MGAYAIQTIGDGVLGIVAPIGLACAAGTTLVIDMVDKAPREGGSLSELVLLGPTSSQLLPQSQGVSFLPNGGIDSGEASEVVAALCLGWPNVVVRVGSNSDVPDGFTPLLVEAVLAGPFAPKPQGFSILQPTGLAKPPKGHDGPVLARLSARRVRAMLGGQVSGSWAWVRSWRSVLEAI